MKKLILLTTFFLLVISNVSSAMAACGDGLCTKEESKINCPVDCDENSCRQLYERTKQICIKNGWRKVYVDVDGIQRELFFKEPESEIWKNGAIIVLHGGEGVDSNFCAAIPKDHNRLLSPILRGEPVVEFSELALKQGFAIFSLNSAFNRGTDSEGRSIGKRWDCLKQDNKENIDLDFIEQVIDETIPNRMPAGSKQAIYMTGISNGGFMTTLAATHFSDKITAFAPVASGDPYGMYFDMGTEKLLKRKCGPGTFRDLETNTELLFTNACSNDSYKNEKQWPKTKRGISFKQFYHMGDRGVHFTCEYKLENQLIKHGYKDDGAFVLGQKRLFKTITEHFWQSEYNQPILNFFKRN